MCVHVYLCVYVCVHVYVRTCVFVCVWLGLHACLYWPCSNCQVTINILDDAMRVLVCSTREGNGINIVMFPISINTYSTIMYVYIAILNVWL